MVGILEKESAKYARKETDSLIIDDESSGGRGGGNVFARKAFQRTFPEKVSIL